MKEDPRRIYFRLLHVLSIMVPNTKIFDEFEVLVPKDLPETTRKLMIEAIDSSMKKLKATEEKLIELKRKLCSPEGEVTSDEPRH
jgi:hypothetical protein